MQAKYRIGIVGGGAVGLTYAALLSDVAKVKLITRRQEQADLINQSGITFEQRGGPSKQYLKVTASIDFSTLKDCDAVIVTVKSYDTQAVAQSLIGNIKTDAIVLTLQNGIEAFDVLQSVIQHNDRVLAGVTYVGAERKDDRAVVNGRMFLTIVDSKATELIKCLEKAEFLTIEATDNAKQAVWDKLFMSVAQNAMSAITNLSLGGMYDCKECVERAENLLAEFKKVAEAEGLTFNYDLMSKVKDNWRGSAFYPSMWQDLHHGRRTEIDAINGAISRLGRKYNIPTPYNDDITKEIKELESKSEAASK